MSSSTPVQVLDNSYTKREVNKGKDILNSPALSEQGRNWLVRALDPYHDSELKCEGYPDTEKAGSVVQEINMSMGISVPASVTSGNNWDCHVFNLADFAQVPGNTTLNPYFYQITTGAVSAAGSSSLAGAGLIALSGAAGTQFLPSSGVAAGTFSNSALDPGSKLQGKCRVIAMGFEVYNTTAPLYKQGVATVYRLSQPKDQELLVNKVGTDSAANSTYSPSVHKLYALPPTSAADALVLPGSKQWDAARGCYCICTLTDTENRTRNVDNIPRLYSEWQSIATTAQTSCGALLSTQTVGAVSSYTTKYATPYNTSGVYFTGLSYQTTLQVNLKVLVETIPDPRSAFASLATASPNYDPEALRLYSEIVCHIPVGVPVDENPSGEWFESVLGTLGDISSMAGAINPIFSVLGKGLGIASKIAPRLIDAYESHHKKKKHDAEIGSGMRLSLANLKNAKAPQKASKGKATVRQKKA